MDIILNIVLIIIGIVVFYALTYGLFSWLSGYSIKNMWGQTIVTPDTLPDMVGSARKLVDSKYRKEEQVKKELKDNLKIIEKKIAAIDSLLCAIDYKIVTSVRPPSIQEETYFTRNTHDYTEKFKFWLSKGLLMRDLGEMTFQFHGYDDLTTVCQLAGTTLERIQNLDSSSLVNDQGKLILLRNGLIAQKEIIVFNTLKKYDL